VTKSLIVFVVVVTVLAGPLLAQRGGGGGGGQSGLPSDINAPRNIPQQFASKLKLDKVQGPAVDQILTAAASEAAPHAQQMLQIRQALLNALRANNAEQLKAAQDAYAAAAAKIAGIEAATFAKVLALLKPDQQRDAAQAFALIAGLFTNPPAAPGARGGAMRGRGGAQ
jgi:hypothetical protein